ncbi:hypothetical protein HT094_22425 [Shewanella sp. ZOR0012]|uniref:hypothetical protein n=1 Tax=Shewanella sp. ZOR0012 TaxID=1339231 RepID=UPI000647F4D9|nr:hypothetical protein [Shewanella sp. ZOR0012]NSM26859.1 hypothetical protein [Shewanella sp. ZOR0012]
MNNNNPELSAAIEKLAQLNIELQQAERESDAAFTHAANYLGNDDEIENHRDNLAGSAYESVKTIEKMLSNQVDLINILMGKK